MTGARFTRTGTPASASVRTVRSRRCGLAARGSRMRESFESSDVMLMLTDARFELRHCRDEVEVAFDQR